jgi:hypothetical protein
VLLLSPQDRPQSIFQQCRAHLLATLYELDCYELATGLVPGQLYKPEGSAVEVSNL